MNVKVNICLFILLLLMAVNLPAKPQSSLFLTVSWVDGFAYETPIAVRAEVLSKVTHEKMRFNLTLPSGVTLLGGKISVELAIEKGAPLFLDFMVTVKKGITGQIKAEASLGGEQQVFFRAVKTLAIGEVGPSQKTQAYSSSTPAFRHVERNGERLREYQLP